MSLLGLCPAGYWAARLGYADALYRTDSLEATAHAVRLDPGNARALLWLAELEEHEGQDPAAALARAAALNPRDAAIRIRLALLAEQRGDFSLAERELEEAARLDHQFDPRAALAQYYFRRGDSAAFWRWVREAFAVHYGDLTPLFQLCWRMTDRADVVRAALPADHALLGRYLHFLLSEDRLDAAAAIAPEFATQAATSDLDLVLSCCDRLLERRNPGPALAAWNPLCGRLLPCTALDAARGISLTNGRFTYEPVLRGFDWRVPSDAEISVTRADSPPSLRISLSGRQPESCELLTQTVPVVPRRKYRLRFEYRTADMPRESGLWWRVDGAAAPIPASAEFAAADFVFDSGSDPLATLRLAYQRPAGSARAEGSITLRSVTLRFAP